MQDPPRQDPLEISREARSLAHRLKQTIKSNDELDKDIEFQRKNLRKQYLKLLLLHPNSKESKDAETSLWMQTSYQFISLYKQKISALDQKIFSPSATHTKGSSRQDHSRGGPVEYRKLLARFRQFLAEEEKFYVRLLIRFRTQFDLKSTREALVKTGVISTDPDEPPKTESSRNIFPEEISTPSESDDERSLRLGTFAKLLVCLGDLARYREQYNDSRGRPRAGHEYEPTKQTVRKGKKSVQDTGSRPRNYMKAQTIYEQARFLVPDDGNASHQLAILAAYQKDAFASLLNYYRALCVRQPYDTASDNLNTVLRKALEQYRTSKKDNQRDDEICRTPKLRVDRHKEWVVVFHGLCYLDPDASAVRASKLAITIVTEFTSLIIERILPSNLICDTLMLALGALWKIRMIRDHQVRADRKVIEPLMASHILDLVRSMLAVSVGQLAEKPEDVQDKDDLAQKITAPFRRILPAIRIGSKWLRSNYGFLETGLSSAATSNSFVVAIKAFWETYASFFTILSSAFPHEKLPELTGPLEEDVLMSGFTPIKKSVFERAAPTENGLASGQDLVHPNEEYLMRLSDLLRDFYLLKDSEKAPIVECDGHLTFEYSLAATSALKLPRAETLADIMDSHPDPPRAVRDSDDDNTTQTSRTEDDVIREAFNFALGAPDPDTEGDEEDEIVWSPPRLSLSPQQRAMHQPQGSPQPTTPVGVPVTRSPPQQCPRGIPSTTTAQDLLNGVLGLGLVRSNGDDLQAVTSSAPQASMLFGSGTLNAPTKSIWTDAGFGNAGGTKHALLPQQNQTTSNDTYVGQGRRHSFSQVKTPSMNSQILPGSPSLNSFVAVPLTGSVHQQMMPQGASTSDLFHLRVHDTQHDARTLQSDALPGQAFEEHYRDFISPALLQVGQGAVQHTYPSRVSPAQRTWNT